MKKILLALAIIMSTGLSLRAANGWFSDYVKLDVNGAGTTTPTGWYWIGADPSYATQLDGTNLGTVSSLIITGCDMKYWSDQGRDGGAFYYKIMSENGSTEIVSAVETIWTQSYLGGVNFQGIASSSINLLTNLTSGTTYKLHIWAKSWGTGGDSWLNNGGSNYVATFTTPAAPIAYDVTGSGSYCEGSSGIPVELSNSESDVTYTLYKNNVAQPTPINGTGSAINFGNQTAGTYTVKGTRSVFTTDMNGSAIITENPLPNAPTIASVDINQFCENAGGNITLTAIGGSGTTLQWLEGSCTGTLVGTGTPLTITKPTVSTTYYARWINGCGNSSCASVQVTVYPLPTATITGTTTICTGSSATISVALTGTPPWAITYTDGNIPVTVSGIAASPYTFVVSPSTATTYSVTDVTDFNCSNNGTGSAVISITTRPTGNISGTTTICAGQSAALSIAATGTGPWSGTLSDGTAFSGALSPIPVNVTPAITTTYTISTLAVGGCSSIPTDLTGSATVTVSSTLPTAPTSASVDVNNFCSNTGGNIVLTATDGSGTTLQWLEGDCAGTPVGTGTTLSIPKPTVTTTYYAQWENVCGISTCASVQVNVIPVVTPAVSITASANPVVSGTSVTFTPAPVNGGATPTYAWYLNGAFQFIASTMSIQPTNGNTVYAIMTTSIVTCVTSSTATSNIITMEVTAAPATSTWTGAGINHDWHNPDNWNSGVPGSTTVVTIPTISGSNYPTVSSSATCYSITIESDASLINNGLLSVGAGKATIKRTISDAADDKWHLFISPITESIPATSSSCFNGAYLDRYDEPSGAWVRLLTNANVVSSYGYSINYLQGSRDLVFTGTLKTSPVVYNNLSYSSGALGYGDGWNLIGNPNTCGLNSDLIPVPSGMNAFAYVWSGGTTGNYTTLTIGSAGNSGIIASLQGFFVRTTSVTNHLSLANAAKVHGGSFQKSENSSLQMLTLSIAGNDYSDEAFVRFDPSATEDFDQLYDAYKLPGLDEAPQLYSILPDEKAAFNTLPSTSTNPLVPLGLKVGAATTYTLTISGMESFDPNIPIRLDDLKLGTSQDVRLNPSYSFTAAPGDAENRFQLRFASAYGIDETTAGNFSIFAAQRQVHIIPNTPATGKVYVYSTTGQLVATAMLNSGETLLTVNAPGVYLVKVVTDKTVTSGKVVIN